MEGGGLSSETERTHTSDAVVSGPAILSSHSLKVSCSSLQLNSIDELHAAKNWTAPSGTAP